VGLRAVLTAVSLQGIKKMALTTFSIFSLCNDTFYFFLSLFFFFEKRKKEKKTEA